jgi:CDP-diacylglycerol---glycerol-3-phosphate 3-phosphatidyltransferase
MELLSSNSLALTSLKKDWMRAGLFFVLFIGGIYLFLERFWQPVYALRWLGLASTFGVWQVFFLWRNLGRNHCSGEVKLLPRLGWANSVSFLRGIFIAALFGFLFSPWGQGSLAWLPFIFYLLAAISDFLDGYLARITNHVTELGSILDMENDSWGVLIVTLLAFWYGQVPIWFLPVGLARYLFIFGLWLRDKMGKENFELPFSHRRRAFAGVQMGFIVAMLVPLYTPPATTFVSTLFALPFLIGFLYDWLLVSGQIEPRKGAAFFTALSSKKILEVLPTLLRFSLAGLLGYFLAQQEIALAWLLVFIPLAFFLALGLAGRLAAILTLIFLGLFVSGQPLVGLYPILFTLSITLFFSGTGAFSLWTPEDSLIYKRAGEKNV